MLEHKLSELKTMVDARLEELLTVKTPELLWNSMAYSVRAGGKRLRPALNLLAVDLLDGDLSQTLDLACAIEMIHTYSLIHDDLPALDDDVLRRGVATNHVVFGEAQAILAGDGLLNYAYEVMLQNALRHADNLPAQLRAIGIVARAAGVRGMIAGQVQDVALEGQPLSVEELEYIHSHKTADMIVGALLSGLELAAPNDVQRAALRVYGEQIGLVFQIVDDVLDVIAGDELGKSRGKDARDGKTTYVTLYGVEKSMQIAEQCSAQAKQALNIFGDRAELLRALADKLLRRHK